MDPYIKMKSRDQEWKSTVQKNAGKEPKWEGECFDIDVVYHGDDLKFKVLDEDVGRDGHVGKGSAKLSTFMHAETFDEWFEIEHKGKPAGKIHLRSEWAPKHGKHGFK